MRLFKLFKKRKDVITESEARELMEFAEEKTRKYCYEEMSYKPTKFDKNEMRYIG